MILIVFVMTDDRIQAVETACRSDVIELVAVTKKIVGRCARHRGSRCRWRVSCARPQKHHIIHRYSFLVYGMCTLRTKINFS